MSSLWSYYLFNKASIPLLAKNYLLYFKTFFLIYTDNSISNQKANRYNLSLQKGKYHLLYISDSPLMM